MVEKPKACAAVQRGKRGIQGITVYGRGKPKSGAKLCGVQTHPVPMRARAR